MNALRIPSRVCHGVWTLELLAALLSGRSTPAEPEPFRLEEATIPDLQGAMEEGSVTSERLVRYYLNRIAAYDRKGPALNSIISLNPDALATARACDEERRISGPRGPLHGIPILLGEYAWYFDNSGEKYQKVGEKKPNPWNLFDMHGNVAEWVLDQYMPEGYQKLGGERKNPVVVPETIYPRGARGGSWLDDPGMLRSAARRGSSPDWTRGDPQIPKSIWYHTDATFVGFRVVRPLRLPSPKEAERYDLDAAQKKALADYIEFLDGRK
jgi:hypothetical protein